MTSHIATELGVEFGAPKQDDGDNDLVSKIADRYFLEDEDLAALKKALGPSPAKKANKPFKLSDKPSKVNANKAGVDRFRAKLIEEHGELQAKKLEPKIAEAAKVLVAEGKAQGIEYTNIEVLFGKAQERVLPARSQKKAKAKKRNVFKSRGGGHGQKRRKSASGDTKEEGLMGLANLVANGSIQ